MRRRVDLPALARASADPAACVTGVRLHGRGRAIRTAPDGGHAGGPPAPASTIAPITLDEEATGAVRLDRLAIAAAAVVERYGPARTTMAGPALVELVEAAEPPRPGAGGTYPAAESASLTRSTSTDGARWPL
ncbi:hypothetical protein [Nonomuraea sp. bgisy101]|uniref:hypothetical protein n=1 Tax=Nonomuraea sp. bgisy101 TaxID=3413784 RepID=UPI003D733E9A